MHVVLPILASTQIMGTDMLESVRHKLVIGNNTTVNLEPDSKEEIDRLYKLVSEGSRECLATQDMAWGAYWGVCLDKYVIRWMFSYDPKNIK